MCTHLTVRRSGPRRCVMRWVGGVQSADGAGGPRHFLEDCACIQQGKTGVLTGPRGPGREARGPGRGECDVLARTRTRRRGVRAGLRWPGVGASRTSARTVVPRRDSASTLCACGQWSHVLVSTSAAAMRCLHTDPTPPHRAQLSRCKDPRGRLREQLASVTSTGSFLCGGWSC